MNGHSHGNLFTFCYDHSVISLKSIRRAFQIKSPENETKSHDEKLAQQQAAVALVLRKNQGDIEIFFIKRASRKGDPWSGHIAFPGGKFELQDASLRATAERETEEETGINLQCVEYLGTLGRLENSVLSMSKLLAITCYLYYLNQPFDIKINYEVEDYYWIPMKRLLNPTRSVVLELPKVYHNRYTGIRLTSDDDAIVWGLTYRFLNLFYTRLGFSLPQSTDQTMRFHFNP